MESDLAIPVRDFLVTHGYTVRSEVLDCDLVAVRGDEVVAVELKSGLNATLLIQAVQRQLACDRVYVAIPRPKGGERGLDWRGALLLLKRLALGLITVALDSPARTVEVVLDPGEWALKRRPKQRARILREVAGRSADFNLAGANRRQLVTAYREAALRIAVILAARGPLRPRDLRALGCDARAQRICYDDHYGWFTATGDGRYALTDAGREALARWPELAAAHAAAVAGRGNGQTA